ncbi:uncharacterized protein G2W53_014052 [Senna tora]|uniref:Uncharacterized protein n=1 Tax=Senna tora TaxID=362788 RepID=A0A834U4X8_9FABA|nr:uncharacterized protein G2W53_014052 [Senna tora]
MEAHERRGREGFVVLGFCGSGFGVEEGKKGEGGYRGGYGGVEEVGVWGEEEKERGWGRFGKEEERGGGYGLGRDKGWLGRNGLWLGRLEAWCGVFSCALEELGVVMEVWG